MAVVYKGAPSVFVLNDKRSHKGYKKGKSEQEKKKTLLAQEEDIQYMENSIGMH